MCQWNTADCERCAWHGALDLCSLRSQGARGAPWRVIWRDWMRRERYTLSFPSNAAHTAHQLNGAVDEWYFALRLGRERWRRPECCASLNYNDTYALSAVESWRKARRRINTSALRQQHAIQPTVFFLFLEFFINGQTHRAKKECSFLMAQGWMKEWSFHRSDEDVFYSDVTICLWDIFRKIWSKNFNFFIYYC